MSADLLSFAYFGIAVVCGVLLATRLVPWPADLVVLLALGILSVQVRRRLPGVGRSIGLEVIWLGCFVVAWLGLGFIINR
jgi:hypothetical protein